MSPATAATTTSTFANHPLIALMPWAIFGHASRLQFDAALKAQFRKIARCMHDQWPAAWSSGRVLRSKCCLQLNIELTHRAVVGSDENNWAVTYLSIFSLSYHLDADTHQLIFGHLSIVTNFNNILGIINNYKNHL